MARRGWPVWAAILAVLVSTFLLSACARPIAGVSPPTSHLLEAYGRLPLHFEANVGQAASAVRFLARTDGGVVRLAPDGLGLAREGGEIRLVFEGAHPAPPLEALEPLPGRVNYYRGADPAKWRTDVPTYGRVRYEGVYPGVDVVVYGNQRRLEYDFVVAPGADPAAIRVRVDGADALDLDAEGDLKIRRGAWTAVQRAPVVYQERDGRRETVSGRYVVRLGNEIGFEIGAYDRSRPLIIDPVIAYSARIGFGIGRAIAADAAGYAYFAGETGGGYPTVNAVFPTPKSGQQELFVTKLSPNGDSLVYSTYIGSFWPDDLHGIATDGAGNAYITGRTHSDYPTTSGAFQPVAHGGSEDGSVSFVTKFGPTGTLVYSTFLDGSTFDRPDDGIRGGVCFQGSGNGIAADASGNAYVVGVTTTKNFPTTPGAYIPTKPTADMARCLENPAGYLTKLSPNGSSLVYSTYLDGHGAGLSVRVDGAGNASVGGTASAPSAPPGTLTASLAASGATTGSYVAKFDATGFPTQTTVIGASPESISLGPDASIYVAGGWSGDLKTTPNALKPTSSGGDGFAARMKADGTAWIWATFVGGSASDAVTGIAADSDGSAWLAGYTSSSDFPTKYPTRVKAQPTEAVTLKFSATGDLLFSTFLGDGQAYGVAIDPAGNVYLTGIAGTDFTPTSPGAYTPTSPSAGDVFVLKYFADHTAPTVAITSPNNGAWTGAGINIVVNGSDAGNLGQIQLWANGAAFATFVCGTTACTFSTRWETGALAPGAYQVQAVATDTSGNCAVSAVVTINKDATTPVKPSGAPACGSSGGGGDTTPPTVAITNPAGGTVSGTVTVSATASDNVRVVGVQFKLDGSNLGLEDATAPYSVSWDTTTATPGTHTLTAVARDAAGNTKTSAPVTVTVGSGGGPGDTTPPTAAITTPATGAWTGNSIHIVANASDNVALASLKIYGNGAVILQKACSGTSCTLDDWWTTGALAPGAYQIQAVATDTAGNCTTTAPVTINKDATTPVKPSGAPACGGGGGGPTPDTTAPAVAISSPTGGTVSGTITVSATASDNVGVVGVQFKLDGANLGAEDTTAPYSVSWNTATATAGTHTLTAVARDAAGNATTSAPVTVTVGSGGGDTTPPTIVINNPSNGAWTGNSIKVTATAGDNVGLASIKLYGNGTLFSTGTCGGATSCTWTDWWSTGALPSGKHTITAVATDTAGNTTSAAVTINK